VKWTLVGPNQRRCQRYGSSSRRLAIQDAAAAAAAAAGTYVTSLDYATPALTCRLLARTARPRTLQDLEFVNGSEGSK